MASCELCNNFAPAKLKYDRKSAQEHAKKHFLQLLIIDDRVSVDDIVGKCFPVRQPIVRRRRGHRRAARTLSRQTLVDLCYSIFPRVRILDSPSHVTCAECGVKVKLLVRNRTLSTFTLIDHTCSHLNVEQVYACHHCSEKFKIVGTVRTHLAKIHRINNSADNHFEDKSHNFVKEISDQMESCFGPNSKVDPNGKWKRIAYNIRNKHTGSELAIKRQLRCHQLVLKIADQDKRIKCRVCSSRFSVKTKDSYSCRTAMEHVLLHLQKPTKRCRQCYDVLASRREMAAHLKTVHKLPSTSNYDCLADEFHTEIMVLIEKCYGSNVDGIPTIATIAPKSVKTIRTGPKMAAERKLLCHGLIRKFANTEKQVQCRLCSKRINAKYGRREDYCTSNNIMQHALRHLEKPLYRCKQCPTTYSCSKSMLHHLRETHALPMSKNYVCSQDEYHTEIMGILRECYGDERVEVKME